MYKRINTARFKQLEPGLCKETKEQKVQRKQLESVPLERKESKELGLQHLNKSADRKLYDHPVDGQAVKTFLKNTTNFEKNYEKLHDTPV